MATNTTNYNFKKPDESDFYSIQDQNGNWDKADAALKDVDTPTFEDYSGSMTVPDAATAINSIRSKGKLSTILSNMKAAFKGACLIGQIVNNCVTNNAKLPLSAAQGKALMDLYTQLNSDLRQNFIFDTPYSTAMLARSSDGKTIYRAQINNTSEFIIYRSVDGGSTWQEFSQPALKTDLSNQRRTITRVRVAITNGVGTYNVTQVGLSGGNCIPVIYSMSDGIFWSEVSVAIQNDLVVVGFSSGQSGWAEVNIFSFE